MNDLFNLNVKHGEYQNDYQLKRLLYYCSVHGEYMYIKYDYVN